MALIGVPSEGVASATLKTDVINVGEVIEKLWRFGWRVT